MKIVAFFSENNQPKTGLEPIIIIRDIEHMVDYEVYSTMVEVGEGVYSYDFEAVDPSNNYFIVMQVPEPENASVDFPTQRLMLYSDDNFKDSDSLSIMGWKGV